MERFSKIAFLLGIAFSFLFFIASNTPVFAQEGGGEAPACPDLGPPPDCRDSPPFRCDVSPVYTCANNQCGKDKGSTLTAKKYYQCVMRSVPELVGKQCPSWTCKSFRVVTAGPFIDESTKREFNKAGEYQICPVPPAASPEQWLPASPAYQCAGKCYPAPNITPLKEVKTPKNVFDEIKLKLPAHFEWEDNVEKELAKPESENKNPETGFCSVESYKYKLSEQGASPLLENEVNPDPVPPNPANPASNRSVIPFPDECKMKPGTPYDFQVQACLQGICGDPGKLAFATSTAPQLLSPYDPDWEEKKSGRTPVPSVFEWCEHPNFSVKSYALNVYEAKKDGTRGARVVLTGTPLREQTKYSDSSFEGGLNQLGKGATYFWEIGACTDPGAKQCGIFSQLWSLVPGGELKAPLQLFPSSGAFVNMTDMLKWQEVIFATHYVVHITGQGIDKDFFTQIDQLSLGKIWPELALTTLYEWRVAPCGGFPASTDIEDCKNKKDVNDKGTVPWSKEQQFTTTGAQPKNLKLIPTETGVAGIPLTLNWDDAGGAASYEVVISPALPPRIVSEKSETTLQYPLLKTKTLYSWTVKTCADKLGNVCGAAASGSFTTVALASPPLTVPTLGQKEFDPSTSISWNKVFSGNFYSYTLTFLSPSSQEVSSECTKTHEAARQIIAENGATVRFRCLGNYTLAVQACIDSNCKEAGGSTVSALSVEKLLARTGGLVPCDRGNDAPGGADERKPCGIEHIFLLIRNIIDFVLWKLTLIIVVLMATATGAIMFFSFGGIDVMTKVRSIWKAVGIGVLILLFSWLFLNILLGLVGFNIKFYGKWYDIQF